VGQSVITVSTSGNFDKTRRRLQKLQQGSIILSVLNRYGQEGVQALSIATPVETGETAGMWSYTVVEEKGFYAIYWQNHHVESGVHIALILQYGHGTGTGGWVPGRDYINPAIRPVMDKIKAEVLREVSSL
jgi:hypothetical protein